VNAELSKAKVEFNATARRFEACGPTAGRSASAGNGSGGLQAQAMQSDDVIVEMRDFGQVDMAILEERTEDAHAILVETRQLNETMQDLAGLVQEQSDQIKELDSNVTTTTEKVQRGNSHLEEATVLQKAARKKQCCILGIVVVILLAICIPVILTQTKSS
jgi:chromosome segregation ATPase